MESLHVKSEAYHCCRSFTFSPLFPLFHPSAAFPLRQKLGGRGEPNLSSAYAPFSCFGSLINPPGPCACTRAAQEGVFRCASTESLSQAQDEFAFVFTFRFFLWKGKKRSVLFIWIPVSKCRREKGPDPLILFSHRGSEAQSAVPSKLIHSGWGRQLNASSVKYLACRQKSWWVVMCRLTLLVGNNAGSQPEPQLHRSIDLLLENRSRLC